MRGHEECRVLYPIAFTDLHGIIGSDAKRAAVKNRTALPPDRPDTGRRKRNRGENRAETVSFVALKSYQVPEMKAV